MSRTNLKNTPQPKMSQAEAVTLWNTLLPSEQVKFKEMFKDLQEGKLMFKEVNIDENENVKNIVLTPKDKYSKPTQPFAKHFDQEIIKGNK